MGKIYYKRCPTSYVANNQHSDEIWGKKELSDIKIQIIS